MLIGYTKNDCIYLVSQETPFSEKFSIDKLKIWKVGRDYVDVAFRGLTIRFRDNKTTSSDMFGRIYYLFKTEMEAENCIKQIQVKKEMKDKISKVISKLQFEELEDIYLYLEARYPEEMR